MTPHPSPTSRQPRRGVALLSLVVTLATLAACTRERTPEPAPEVETAAEHLEEGSAEQAGVAEAAPAADAVVSPAPAASGGDPPAQPQAATRPDALLAALPNAATIVGVDVDAVARWVSSAGARGTTEETANAMISTLLRDTFPGATLRVADGTRAFAVAVNEGALVVALSDAPQHVTGGATIQRGEISVVEFGPSLGASAGATPGAADSAVVAHFTDLASAPTRIRASIDFLDQVGVSGASVDIRADGAIEVVLTTDDADAVSRAFGRGQAFASQTLGQLTTELPAQARPWITYLNRVSQGLFSRVTITPTDGGARLAVVAPTCGGPLRNLGVVATVVTLADFAAEDTGTPTIPFVPMEVATAESCAPLQGPAGNIPAHLARFGTTHSDRAGVLFAMDLPATLREGLPTGFGLLPFALDDATLHGAFGMRPFGLRGFDDPEGALAYIRDWDADPRRPEHALLLPPHLSGWVINEHAVDTMRPTATADTVGWASPGFDIVARSAVEENADWDAALAALPQGTYAALVLNDRFVELLTERLDDGLVRGTVATAETIVVSLQSGGFSLQFVGVSNADPDALRDALPDALTAMVGGDAAAPTAESRRDAARGFIDSVELRVSGDTLTLAGTDAGGGALAAALRLGIPMLGGLIERTSVGLPEFETVRRNAARAAQQAPAP